MSQLFFRDFGREMRYTERANGPERADPRPPRCAGGSPGVCRSVLPAPSGSCGSGAIGKAQVQILPGKCRTSGQDSRPTAPFQGESPAEGL